VVLLANGRIEQRGRMRDLIRSPATAFVTEFVRAQQAPLDAMREAAA
jgi:ABC-type proline/glycine betaine transport system ATPase subunit